MNIIVSYKSNSLSVKVLFVINARQTKSRLTSCYFKKAYDNKKFVTSLTRVAQYSRDEKQTFINTSDRNKDPFNWNSIDISDTVGVIDIFYG